MIGQFLPTGTRAAAQRIGRPQYGSPFQPAMSWVLAATLLTAGVASAQITIDSHTGVVTNGSTGTTTATVDRRYQQIKPTDVALPKTALDPKTRLELIRLLQAEQGFAMRPFPRGHKGLTLLANGKLEPAGEGYLNMVTSQGVSANPGDRVILTDLKIEHNRIVFDLNGGPDAKHRFLRHIEIGAGPNLSPVVQNGDGQEPTGARLTLAFQSQVPELTGLQVKSLLAPLISFDLKTPIQAYTDTLPTKLKEAILDHHVLVGMSTDMVLFAKGQPESKSREMEGQMPFEEWIYGQPPKEVDFVRINGNRVIRVEIAKMGETPVIFTKDEVEGLMRTDGSPLEAGGDPHTRTVKEGDVARNPDTEAPAAPPSLRQPGEKLPTDSNADRSTEVMKPVRFPKPRADDQSSSQSGSAQPAGADSKGQDSPPPSSQAPLPDASQASPAKPPEVPAPSSGEDEPN